MLFGARRLQEDMCVSDSIYLRVATFRWNSLRSDDVWSLWGHGMNIWRHIAANKSGISCGNQDALNRVKRARNREEKKEKSRRHRSYKKNTKKIRISRLEVTVMAKDSRVSPAWLVSGEEHPRALIHVYTTLIIFSRAYTVKRYTVKISGKVRVSLIPTSRQRLSRYRTTIAQPLYRIIGK